MKKIIASALVLASFVIWGCSKDGSSHPVLTNVTGTWKFIGYSGGFAGFPFTPVDTVESYIRVDTLNARILFSINGQQQCTGYTFETKSEKPYYGILSLNDTIMYTTKLDVYLNHDTLTVYPHDFADAFSSSYMPVSKHFNWCQPGDH